MLLFNRLLWINQNKVIHGEVEFEVEFGSVELVLTSLVFQAEREVWI